MSDFFDEADESAKAGSGEQNPTMKWDEDGKVLKGIFVEVRPQGLKSGDIVLMATIKEIETDQVWAVWLSSRILLDGFLEAAPATGSKVYIMFEGKKPTKDGQREYNMFHVRAEVADHELWRDAMSAKANKAIELNPAGRGAGEGSNFKGPSESPF